MFLLADHGEDAKVIAGGQSLMPLLAFRLARPHLLVDLTRVPGLDGLVRAGRTLSIGGLSTHRAVERAPGDLVPDTIRTAIGHIGHVGIRNRGTVGGSLAHADPSAEWAAVALAYDGVIQASKQSGKREIPAAEFFLDLWTNTLKSDEVITGLRLDIPGGLVGSSFHEYARRHGDFAIAGVCAVLTVQPSGDVRTAALSVIGAGRTAARAADAAQALVGRRLEPEAIQEAARLVAASIDPRGDDDDERAHRIQVARTLARRAIEDAAGQIEAQVSRHG